MSTEVNTFESIKELLQTSQQCGAIKTDLFTHITEIVNRILTHHKYDGYQKFEEISLLIKKTQLNVKNPKTSEQIKAIAKDSINTELENYVKQVRDLLHIKHNLDPLDKVLVDKTHK